jgi:hypothetical protein
MCAMRGAVAASMPLPVGLPLDAASGDHTHSSCAHGSSICSPLSSHRPCGSPRSWLAGSSAPAMSIVPPPPIRRLSSRPPALAARAAFAWRQSASRFKPAQHLQVLSTRLPHRGMACTSGPPGFSALVVTQVARCGEEVSSLAPFTSQARPTRSVALAHVAATGVPVGVTPPFAPTHGLCCGGTIGLASLHGALLTLDM